MKKKFLMIVLVLIFIVAGFAGGYWWGFGRGEDSAKCPAPPIMPKIEDIRK